MWPVAPSGLFWQGNHVPPWSGPSHLRTWLADSTDRRGYPGGAIVVQSQSPSSAAHVEPNSARSDRTRAWAWGICWLMFASTVLNYMDRQAIALVGPEIKAQFGLDNLGFGW